MLIRIPRKFTPGIRFTVILLFTIIIISSLIMLNSFFVNKQEKMNEAFQSIQLDQRVAKLQYKTHADTVEVEEILKTFRQSLAGVKLLQQETKVYSSLIFFDF